MNPRILTCSTALIAFLLLAACTEDQDADLLLPVDRYQVTTQDYIFYSNLEKYKDTHANRLEFDDCSYSWSIQQVNRNENVLTVDIVRPQACAVLYELIWDGAIRESYPMMANVFLRASSEGCTDGAEKETDRLVIDLKEAFKNVSEAMLRDINFNLKEACSIKDHVCMEDCDLSVSN